uniref:receptor-type tyrosine-protein phosphatase eta isoform X2 n=1 Tax=Semicossyphus pulcher TaxID=241346 RepID=UPI0037E8ED9F
MWAEPEGESSFYRVQWTNGRTNWNISVTETNINITELTAGVQYNFTVIAVAGDNTTESAMAETFHFTKPQVVRNLTVLNVTTSSMFLTWTEPEGQRSFYKVQWTHGEIHGTVNVKQTHIDITNLTAGVQYEITVTAVAGDGLTEGQNTIVSKYTKPEVVRNLTVGQVTTSSISLMWAEPEGESSFYRVQWTNRGTNRNISVTETNINITELTAGVQYNFTVIAVAGDNTTESAMAETFHFTKPQVVRNLSVLNVTTSSMFLTWTEPEGQSSFYKVQWTKEGLHETVNVDETHIDITNLTAGVQYEITVTAVAGDGLTEGQNTIVSKYTKPEVVRNLTVGQVTTSSISLMWAEPEGESSFYRVQWTNRGTNRNISVTETNINITELTAGVQYNFTVIAVAGDNTTESAMAETFHFTKPQVVRNLSVLNVTTSSMFLTWTEPEGQSSFYKVQWTKEGLHETVNVDETHIDITNLTAGVQYEITVTAVAGDGLTEGQNTIVSKYTKPEVVRNLTVGQVTTSSISLMWAEPEGESSFYRVQWTNRGTNRNISVTETNINITELTAGVQYNFTVIAVAGDNTTESAMAETFHFTKPQVVRNLSVLNVTTSSMFLTWTEPEGQSSFYKVQWTKEGRHETVNVDETHVNITNLTAGVQYEITVTAVAGDGLTEGQDTIVSKYTKPGIIENPVMSTTNSSISVNWTPPPGEVFRYRVEWHDGGTVMSNYTNTAFAVLSDLIPGTTYTISITAVNGDNVTGEPYTFTSVTRPVKPVNITLGSRGTDNLKISWTLPEGRFDQYMVKIVNDKLMYSNSSTTTDTTFHFTGLHPGRVFVITVSAVAGGFNETSDQSSLATDPTPPGLVSVSLRTNSSLNLAWATPALMENAPDISYHIAYYTSGSDVKDKTATVNNTELSLLLSGTQYNITVRTVGPQNLFSSAVSISPFTLPNPVLNLVASPNSTTSVEVRWSSPQGAQDHYSYLVQTYSTTGTLINKTVSSNSAVLSELEPGTRYNISVRTRAAPGSESADEFTLSYTLSKAVTNLTVENVTTTTIQVSWSRQSDHKHSYSYRVMVLRGAMEVYNNSTEKETYTFFDLCPGTLYTLKVITVVDVVESSAATTSSYTKPAAVSDISATGNTTSLSVSWTPAVCQVDSYTVQLHRDGELVGKDTDLSNITVYRLFGNLKAGVLYCVLVITNSGPFKNESSRVCNATFPNPPGPITVESQTVESINFTWPIPEDMDHKQYNFSVSSYKGSFLTENNWFLLDKLQSGSLNNISVVTVGVLNYESTAEMAENYTRPHPVTLLAEKTEITTDSVTLVWEQQESKSHYSYVVQASNNAPSDTVLDTTKKISGLLSGSNYSFTVITQTADGTQAAPVTVSYFTRPYSARHLEAETLNTTAVSLFWTEPLEYKLEYTYRVETKGCDSYRNKTLTGNITKISQLTPGTECTFCVAVRAADGIEGEANCTSQYTKPEKVQPSISSQGSNSSVLVSWTAPPGKVEHYKVHLNGTSESSVLNPSDTSFMFEGLSAGRIYTAWVTTCSGPFNAPSGFVTNATFPNPPGPIEILSKTTGSIHIKWDEAPQMTGASFSYQLTNISAEGGDYISTNNISHNFTSLLSGTSYNISVLTVGVMGFKSEKVQIHMVTTRPFSVKSLSASEDEESIRVAWDKPDQYKESYRFILTQHSLFIDTTNTTFTFDKLDPGTNYTISVTTKTSDGTKGDPRPASKCTRASPVTKITCHSPNDPEAEVNLSWTCPKGRHSGFHVTVNNSDPIISTSTDCNYTVPKLRHHTQYNLTVETQSCGRASTPVSVLCWTGITNPPPPEDYKSLVTVKETEHYRFLLQIESSQLNSTNGPITHIGVLVTDKNIDTSDFKNYLGKTYNQWTAGETLAYLATVKEINPSQSRSAATHLSLEVGDDTRWEGYTNGVLQAKGKYQFAVVLFTSLSLHNGLVDINLSLVSTTQLSDVLSLPQNPVVIGLAVGVTLGIFCILFLVLIGFIIYWKRMSNKESPDIQIHSMSVAVSVEDFEAYYRKQKADSNCGFAEEFEDLKVVGTGQSKINALNVDNKPKNRYNNVLPWLQLQEGVYCSSGSSAAHSQRFLEDDLGEERAYAGHADTLQ